VTPCSVAVGCRRFGGPCCLHLQGQRWYPTATLHGATTQTILHRHGSPKFRMAFTIRTIWCYGQMYK